MKMKLAIVLSTFLVIFFTSACETQVNINETEQQVDTERSNMPVVDPVTIRFGHAGPDDITDQLHYGATTFARKVSELSDGLMQVDIYPAATLGHTPQLIEMLQDGTLHMGDIENAPMTAFIPEVMWSDLPYIIQSYEHAEAVFDARSSVSRWIRPIYIENGFRVLGVYHTGFRHMMNDRNPIFRPVDMEGLIMRVMPSVVMMETLRAFGAEVVTIPFADVYSAILRGEINGNEQPLGFVYSMNFYEVQPFLTMTGHFYNPRSYIFSEQLWQQLTPAQQLILIEATEYAVERMNEHHHANQIIILHRIMATGMRVTQLPSENMNAFREVGASVWPMFYEDIGSGNAARGSVILDMILSYIPAETNDTNLD